MSYVMNMNVWGNYLLILKISPFYQELVNYRKKYNPNTKAFVIDLTPYRSGMVPPSDPLSYYIYGWSDQVLQYISFATNGYGSMVAAIREG